MLSFRLYKNGLRRLQASGHSQFLQCNRIPCGKIVEMTVSASYALDITAFYKTCLINRFAVGNCKAVDPWNRKPYTVSLAQCDGDTFLFWTRHLAPSADFLSQIAERAPLFVQHTVTVYQRSLERSAVTTERAATDLNDLAERFESGPPYGATIRSCSRRSCQPNGIWRTSQASHGASKVLSARRQFPSRSLIARPNGTWFTRRPPVVLRGARNHPTPSTIQNLRWPKFPENTACFSL